MLRSDLYDYNDTYIVMKKTILVESTVANNRMDKILAFTSNVHLSRTYKKSLTSA